MCEGQGCLKLNIRSRECVTGALVEVLVVDDDAVADRRVAQTVSGGVCVAFGVHLHRRSSSSHVSSGTASV